MANVLYYYTDTRDMGCGCCHERVVEWELRDESGKVIRRNDNGPLVSDAEEAKLKFAYLAEDHDEFEMDAESVYF